MAESDVESTVKPVDTTIDKPIANVNTSPKASVRFTPKFKA